MWKTPCLSEDGEALPEIQAQSEAPNTGVMESSLGSPHEVRQAPVWLAAYTTPRHEKAVVRHLEVRDVEYFLPLYKTVRKWRNGCTVEVEFPVFPSYVFVHVDRELSNRVLGVPGVLAFAGSGKLAVPIPSGEIERLRSELPHRRFEPCPYLVVGGRVRIIAGPLAGMSGVLTRLKSGLRVVLSIELIRQSVAVEVSADEIEICRS
jgi:transcription termination/antitermination protein NusG